jgi:hypothetical protein
MDFEQEQLKGEKHEVAEGILSLYEILFIWSTERRLWPNG